MRSISESVKILLGESPDPNFSLSKSLTGSREYVLASKEAISDVSGHLSALKDRLEDLIASYEGMTQYMSTNDQSSRQLSDLKSIMYNLDTIGLSDLLNQMKSYIQNLKV